MTKYTPFPQVSSKYGAPMGRTSANLTGLGLTPADMCCSHPQGGYDSGGAYWGLELRRRSEGGEGPVYAVWPRGKGKQLGTAYVRAWSPAEAINKAINGE